MSSGSHSLSLSCAAVRVEHVWSTKLLRWLMYTLARCIVFHPHTIPGQPHHMRQRTQKLRCTTPPNVKQDEQCACVRVLERARNTRESPVNCYCIGFETPWGAGTGDDICPLPPPSCINFFLLATSFSTRSLKRCCRCHTTTAQSAAFKLAHAQTRRQCAPSDEPWTR